MTRGMFAVGLVALVGCGGRWTNGIDGVAAPTDQPSSCEPNPYGACYPTDHVGLSVGTRIPNFEFIGFPAIGTAVVDAKNAEPKKIALADYFDPDGISGNILIVININVVWCGPSSQEADFFSGGNYTGTNTGGASFARDLAPKHVVVLEALMEGPVVDQPATLADLRTWDTNHAIDYTAFVDESGTLTQMYEYAAIPEQVVIDARTMKIIQKTVGFNTNDGEVLAALADHVAALPPGE